MKRILSICLCLVLLLTTCLAMALPAAATLTPRQAAVIAAADRLVAVQNTDGGFPWDLPSTTSHTNVLGVTAMGIMKAWEIDSKSDYDASLAKAYKYVVDNAPVFTWSAGKYTESTLGVDSDPDITFLLELASAADKDANLLAALQLVPSTTAANIADLAKTRWDNKVLHLSSTVQTPPNGTATGYATWERDLRHGTDGAYDAYIPWNLELAVEAALALGYNTQANEITIVMYASIDDGTYFSSTDATQIYYIGGLTGAVKAAAETGLAGVQAKAATLQTLLLNAQQVNGSWLSYNHEEGNVQSTAYAIMALYAKGGANSILAANKAADWLVSTQSPGSGIGTGGWNCGGTITPECAEADSEAAWALYTAAGSSSVGMTASYIAPVTKIGISVTPTTVNFGSLTPGTPSTGIPITVTNTGNVAEKFTATLANLSTPDVYTPGLSLGGGAVSAWAPDAVAASGTLTPNPSLILTIPVGTAAGTYTGTLVFWAEAD